LKEEFVKAKKTLAITQMQRDRFVTLVPGMGESHNIMGHRNTVMGGMKGLLKVNDDKIEGCSWITMLK